jgi:hypothetical protein
LLCTLLIVDLVCWALSALLGAACCCCLP